MKSMILSILLLSAVFFLAACGNRSRYQPEADDYVSDEYIEADDYVSDEHTEAEVSIITVEAVPTPEPPVPVSLPESTHPGYSWVLPPIYSWIQPFGDGFILVQGGDRARIICALTGEVIIPPIFQMIGNHEGLQDYMPARLDGRWGVVNIEGEVVLPFKYVHLTVYADYGVVHVRCDNWTFSGIVELYTGRVIVPFGVYHSISRPRDGISQVMRRYGSTPNHTNVHGFINVVTGEEIVFSIHSNHSGFSYGMAAVRADDLWGFIDTAGELVIPHIYDNINSGFTNGVAAVNRGGLWGIIDTTGAYILPPTYDGIQWPFGGFAEFSVIDPVSLNRYVGILDMQTGEEVVPAVFQGAFFAGEGIVLMRKGDWQCHENNVLINLETGWQFAFPYNIGDDIGYCGPIAPQFVNGISIVHVIGPEWRRFYGIADNEGREILPPIYCFIDWLPGGLLAVSKGAHWGIVNTQGQVVLPLVYCEIETALGGRDPGHDISAIRIGGEWVRITENTPQPFHRLEGALWGFVDVSGQIVVPPILDFLDVRTIGHGTAAVQTSDGWGLIRIYPQPIYTAIGHIYVYDPDSPGGYLALSVGDDFFDLTLSAIQSSVVQYDGGQFYRTVTARAGFSGELEIAGLGFFSRDDNGKITMDGDPYVILPGWGSVPWFANEQGWMLAGFGCGRIPVNITNPEFFNDLDLLYEIWDIAEDEIGQGPQPHLDVSMYATIRNLELSFNASYPFGEGWVYGPPVVAEIVKVFGLGYRW